MLSAARPSPALPILLALSTLPIVTAAMPHAGLSSRRLHRHRVHGQSTSTLVRISGWGEYLGKLKRAHIIGGSDAHEKTRRKLHRTLFSRRSLPIWFRSVICTNRNEDRAVIQPGEVCSDRMQVEHIQFPRLRHLKSFRRCRSTCSAYCDHIDIVSGTYINYCCLRS